MTQLLIHRTVSLPGGSSYYFASSKKPENRFHIVSKSIEDFAKAVAKHIKERTEYREENISISFERPYAIGIGERRMSLYFNLTDEEISAFNAHLIEAYFGEK